MADETKWFFVENGAQAGPVNEQVIQVKISAGEITLETNVWKAGMPEWIKAADTELAQLFSESPAKPEPAAPPAPVAPIEKVEKTEEPVPDAAPAEGRKLSIRKAEAPETAAAPQSPQDSQAATAPAAESNVYTPGANNPFAQGQQGGAVVGSQGRAPGAKAALVFGILSFFCCGIVFGWFAIAKGRSALKLISMDGGYSGKGMATAGVVLGVIGLGLTILGIALNALLGVGMSSFSEFENLLPQ